MLIALDKDGKTINLLDNSSISGPFYCPACKSPLRLKKGKIKIPHFAHISVQNCDSWSENESAQHLGLKLSLYQWFKKKEKVELEKYVPEIKQTADLLVNDKLAIEIQCSPLSLQRLEERTVSYKEKGYYVLWLQGRDLWLKNNLSSLQKNLLYYSAVRGFYFWELDWNRKKLRLKSLIYQDLKGRPIYLTEEFDFFQENLLELLRQPFREGEDLSLDAPKQEELQLFVQKQLYYQMPKWLKMQEKYYEQGKNLLDLNWNKSYWSPPGLNLLTFDFSDDTRESFFQVDTPLEKYYHSFYESFQLQEHEKLHTPSFYAIIKDKNKVKNGEWNGKKT
ncbi:competence protein CoiA [Lactococcus petauri]|uniref:Competence protein CoiA n=1 Tax=Lactococcus petauri TaxID=1940789 RepID=A0A252CG35_9LACT|nr:competence protein CoiA family protein [Lactococcus petauri]MBD5823299.1 competence protein CoiA [Lactococcus petauri]OUK05503.1 competence protein CoiA [Lactococcus petauri]USI66171.1 competence protein CoiA [Lactococcus petauri]